MRNSKRKAVCFLVIFLSLALQPAGSGARLPYNETFGAQKGNARKVTLNGVTFAIPKGYVQIPQREVENSAFLFYRKYGEIVLVAVPSGQFNEDQLLKDLTRAALTKFLPKEPQTFEWKRLNNRRKISRFEIGGDQAMGFNKRTVMLTHSHHFRFAQRDIFVTDLFKWDHGDAQEFFAQGLGGESMQGCNDMVEIVYSITGEKIDETNSPCELIAILPSDP